MNTFDKPYFNGAEYVVAEKSPMGLTVYRHKFATEAEANKFYRQSNTEQPTTKASLGGSENK